MYAVSVVDDRGRIAVHGVLPALGWHPDAKLAVRPRAGLILVVPDGSGNCQVDRKGRLRIPIRLRRWCGLPLGSRALLVADPETGQLVVHPSAALDRMINRRHAEVFGGDPA
ncbi:AbrB/MazE/SpoVT family DNA-binding domain-containing protein [Krasilnikovia sp. M28-CT-15]|uniref:AbrB/MazE/SpoVT family DNA-binding domain-containing protein n=1 Tax=Krasilnikovia sp. M28-CT-15 TaxID=3373540 RepID=UPI00399CD2EA